MKLKLTSVAAGAVALAFAATTVVAVSGVASAYTGTPPWVGVADDLAHVKGGVIFYDAAGAVITGGTDITSIATYVGVDSAGRANATKAALSLAAPSSANSLVSTWTLQSVQNSTTFSPTPAGTPGTVSANGNPFLKLNATGADILTASTAVTLDSSTAAYKNVVELRVQDSGVGVALDPLQKYWRADIEFNPALSGPAYDGLAPQEWRVIYPAASSKTATTTTTPVPSVASPAGHATAITLSATAAAGVAHPAGTLQFKDGVTNVGSAIAVDGAGLATTPSFTPADGAHSFTAVFTPTDTATYNGSTSSALAYTVNAVVKTATTVTIPSPSASSPVAHATAITLSAAAAAGVAHPAGTLQFKDGVTNVGSAIAVDGAGLATTPSFTPADGAHSFTAVFTPTDTTTYNGSTSSALAFTVDAIVKTSTTVTTPAPSVASPIVGGTSITLSATAAAGAAHPAGTLQFKDGATNLGSAIAVDAAGLATTPSFTPAAASHSYTAVFVPTDTTTYNGATSSALAFTVTAAPADSTTTTIATVSPASTADTSTPVVITAHVADTTTPASIPTGSVAIRSDGNTVATVTVDGSGNAVVTIGASTLSIGAHSFTATYVPTGSFTASSTSGPTAYTITLALPANAFRPAVGTARVGVVSTCNPGVWTYAGVYTYQWYLDGSAIPFSSAAGSGLLPASYVGHKVSCKVTASNPGGSSTATSVQVTVGAGAASKATVRAKILGTAKVGRTLVAYKGIWKPAPTRYLYVWKSGGAIVSRAAAYKVTARDKGKAIVLYVYAVHTGYLTGVSASLAVRAS